MQIVIDQSHDNPDLGQAVPSGQIIRSVLHEEGHNVPSLQADRDRPMRVKVRPPVKLSVGPGLALEHDGRLGIELVTNRFPIVRQQDLAVRA